MKLKASPPKGCHLVLFNTVLEVLATAIREAKEIKGLEKKKLNSHCLQMT